MTKFIAGASIIGAFVLGLLVFSIVNATRGSWGGIQAIALAIGFASFMLAVAWMIDGWDDFSRKVRHWRVKREYARTKRHYS